MIYTIDNQKVTLMPTDKLINSPVWTAYVQSIPCSPTTASGVLCALVGQPKAASERRAA